MDVQTLIANRLSLQTTKNSLYSITKYDIQNFSELKSYIVKHWQELTDYQKHQIIKLLGGNYSGKGKNLKLVEKYINELNHETA